MFALEQKNTFTKQKHKCPIYGLRIYVNGARVASAQDVTGQVNTEGFTVNAQLRLAVGDTVQFRALLGGPSWTAQLYQPLSASIHLLKL